MDVVLICAQAGLALVFIAAGVAKLLDLPGSKNALQGFGVPERWSVPGAWLLPVVELIAAAALLAEPLARVGAGLALLLLAAFSLGTANALRQGRAPDCHCFGQLHSAPAGRGTIVRNVVLAAPAVFVAAAGPGDGLAGTGTEPTAMVALSALAAALAVATAVLIRDVRGLRRGALAGTPEPLEIGTPAPALSLRDAQGSPLAITDAIHGEVPSVLVFVHPGCGACTALMPQVEQWRPALSERVALVVISSSATGGPTAEDARDEPGIIWEIDNAAVETYRLLGTPSALLVDPDGTIASAPALGNVAIEALIRVARHRRRPARRPVAA